jgi:hypothetical protein
MEFIWKSLGSPPAGTIVIVTLSGVESDVFLVDGSNYNKFRQRQRYERFGGHYKASPVRLVVPHRAQAWTAVVVPGAGGSVRATFEVIAPAA